MLLFELWHRHHFAEGQTGFIQLWSCDYLRQPCRHDKIKKVRLLFVAHRVLLDPSNFNIYLFIYNLTLKINSVFNSCHFLRRSESCVFCHVRVKREKEAKNRIVQRTMQWEMERMSDLHSQITIHWCLFQFCPSVLSYYRFNEDASCF